MQRGSAYHARWRRLVSVISLLLLSSCKGPYVATGPLINFCGILPPNVTRTGSFDIKPPLPYGQDVSCPDMFRVRWLNAANNRVKSQSLLDNTVYSDTCSHVSVRQVVHRENFDTATGTTTFTLVSDKSGGCGHVDVKKNEKLTTVCFCPAVSAVLDKGANYRVYVGCVSTPYSGNPTLCEFHSRTDDQ
jgi:hypothetical protein